MFRLFFLLMFCGLLAACASSQHLVSANKLPDSASAQAQGVTYRKADRLPNNYQRLHKQCLTNPQTGEKVCGYDCKQSQHDLRCASSSKQRCVIGPLGNIACGYDCKVSKLMAACGKYIYDNCVVSAAGEIRCGNNCRLRDDGLVICGK